MMKTITKHAALPVEELNIQPKKDVLLAILNYSKSLEIMNIKKQKILLNLN